MAYVAFTRYLGCLPDTRGVAVAIFSFRFHVLYFRVSYWLTISYLTKHENQIVFHTVKQEF